MSPSLTVTRASNALSSAKRVAASDVRSDVSVASAAVARTVSAAIAVAFTPSAVVARVTSAEIALAFAVIADDNTLSWFWNSATISVNESSAAGSTFEIMLSICACNAVSAA